MVIRKILTAAFAAAVVLLSSNSGECANPIPGPGGGYLCTSSVQGQAPEPKKVQSAIPETEQAKASPMPELEARAQKVAYKATAPKVNEAKVRYMLIGGKPHKVTIGTSGHVVAVCEIAEMPKVQAPAPVKKIVAEAPRYSAATSTIPQAEYVPAPAKAVANNGEIRNGDGTQRLVLNQESGQFVWEDILNEFQLNEGNVSQRRKGTVWKSPLPQGLWEPYGVEFKKGPSTVFYGEVNSGFYPDPKNTRFYRAVGRVPNTTQLFEAAVVPVENQKPGKKNRRVAVVVDGVCPPETKFVMTDTCPAENMADRGRLPWGNFEGQVGELLSGRALERDPKFGATFAAANGTAVSQLTSAVLDEGQRDQLLRERLGLPLYKVEPQRYIYFAIRGKGADRTIARLMAEDAGINWGDQWVRTLGGGYPPSPIGAGVSAAVGLVKSTVTPSKMPRLTTQQRGALLRSVETVPVAYDNSRGYGGSIGKSPSYTATASSYAPSNVGGRQVMPQDFLRQASGEWANADPSGWLYHPKNNLASGELQKSVIGFGGERYKEAKGTARTSSWYYNSVVLPEFLGFEPIPGKSWVNPGFAVATSGYRGKFKDLEGRNWPYKGNRAGIGPAVAAGFNFDDGSWMQIIGAATFGNKTNPQGANLARVGSTQYEAQIEYGKDWLVTGELSWFPGFKLGIFGDNRQIQSAGNLKVVRTMGDEVQISATLTNVRQSTAPGVFVELLRGGVWAGASLDNIRFSWGVGGNPVKAIDYLSELRYRSFIIELPKGHLPQDAPGYK